jgi:hypothetical protein
VFTARYGLDLYITQIRFVFKRLNPGSPCQRNVQGQEVSVRQQIRLQFKEKLEKFYIWSIPLLDADT